MPPGARRWQRMTRASCIPAGGCWHCELSCQPFVSCSASPFRRRPISSAAAFAASAPRAASPGWAPCPAAEAPGSAPGGWPWRRQRWVMLEDWRSNKKAVTLARGAPPAVASSHRGHHHPVSSSPEERKKEKKKKKKTLNDSKQTEPAPRQTTSCQLQTSDSVGKKNRNQGRVFIVGATPDRCENKDPSCLSYDFIWYYSQIKLSPAVYNNWSEESVLLFLCLVGPPPATVRAAHLWQSVSLPPENQAFLTPSATQAWRL